jgi:hypothetical protein
MKLEIGQSVIFEDRKFTILGFAASKDINGNPLIEIAWNDFSVSPTGYLAVSELDIKFVKREASFTRRSW